MRGGALHHARFAAAKKLLLSLFRSAFVLHFVEFDEDKAVERKFAKFSGIFRLVFELAKLGTPSLTLVSPR